MNLNAQISALETKLKQRDARILKLRKELREARRYIHELTRPSDAGVDDEDMDVDVDDDDGDVQEGDDEDDDEGDEENDSELPEVLLLSEVYACSNCGAEVLEGLCHGYLCGMMHQWPPKDGIDEEYSVSTNSLAIHPDRSLVPRGDTPLRDIDPNCNPSPPEEYEGRAAEYFQLLKRGATRLMCENFHLEFTHKCGIYAWADSEIFDDFSGPLMKPGHSWKIHLGRRIELEEDDLEGSAFIEDLLEDAVMYPMRVEGCSKTHERWETREETRGVWATRLKAHKEDPDEEDRCDASDSDANSECQEEYFNIAGDAALEQPPSGGAIALNEYLSASDDEEDLDKPDHTDDDDDDDDDYDSLESEISDSEDQEVYDSALQLASMFGPDRVWNANEDDEDSEDEEYDELSEQE